eukprot:TRINITY_DN22014_c0_g1_i1.p1 TRINITY_DN22014_c0_g1~~TRINITY_DN22014_c0_g1_i1.p1  ORF type:complete len:315 (-),score=-0.15 TRINITY_DN22014_c0_g1_i1:31-975(-)
MSSSVGDKNRQDGENKLAEKSFFGFGKQAKFEEAFNYFKVAANAYKLNDQFQESGDCYMKANECAAVVDGSSTSTDCINMLIEAANVYKRVDLVKAIETFNKAVQIYCDSQRIGQAARYQKEIAEMLENDNNLDMALIAYEKAADLYSKDNKASAAKDCNLKVAFIYSSNACGLAADTSSEDPNKNNTIIQYFQKASNIYATIGEEALKSKLGSFSAKGHFFNSLLCTLALGDEVELDQKLNQYKNLDHTFGSSRECTFIEKLKESISNCSIEDFSNACSDFDRITPLDPWKTSMLLRIKNITVGATGGEEDLT